MPHGRAFVLRALVIALGIVLVAVLATGATEVKERWLQPILFMLPFALMILVEPRLTLLRERLLILFPAAIGVILLVTLAVTYLLPDLHGGPFRATAPFGPLAADIRELGFEDGYVLAEDHYIGGNLKLHLPGVTVAEPEYGLWPSRRRRAADAGARSPGRASGTRPPKAAPRRSTTGSAARMRYGDPVATRLSEPYEHATKLALRDDAWRSSRTASRRGR